jgi:signal transduction histidine kinase
VGGPLGRLADRARPCRLGQYEIWVQSLFQGDDGIPGPRPINAALFVLITLPLAWRRRAPLTVVGVVAAAAAVQAVFFDRSNQPSTQLWLAVLIALYSVAAHGERRDALLGGALVAAGTLAIDVRHLAAGERSAGEVLGEWALFAGVWLLGRYVHGWRLRARQQQERADQLELDREERARAAVAQERTRIARELHDIVAHGISVMVVQARGGRRMLTVDPDEAREAFDAIESTGRQALGELRRLLGMLRRLDEQPTLTPQPSLDRLGELIDQVQEAGLPVRVAVEGQAIELPPGVDLSPTGSCKRRSPTPSSTPARPPPRWWCATTRRIWSWRSPTTATAPPAPTAPARA